MSNSVRVGHSSYPPEVDDLVRNTDERLLSYAAAGGFVVIASPRSDCALLFSVPLGARAETIPIPMPSSTLQTSHSAQSTAPNSPPIICMWLAETEGSKVKAVGIAFLTRQAVLRVYPSISVQSRDRIPCQEIRVAAALAESVQEDHHCPAIGLVPFFPAKPCILVLGVRGSSAVVNLTNRRLSVTPLPRERRPVRSERSSLRFSSMIYSAIRTIGAGMAGRDNAWETGEGPYAIIGTGVIDDDAIVIRGGGDIERWNAEGLSWTVNMFESSSYRPSQKSITFASVSSEGALVLIVETTDMNEPEQDLVYLDVRPAERPPALNVENVVSLPLNVQTDGYVALSAALSGDIVYLYSPTSCRIMWRSTARGVPDTGQVQGGMAMEALKGVVGLVDISSGLDEAITLGGMVACLHGDGIMLASCHVPAPLSCDDIKLTAGVDAPSRSFPVFWRSFLQYEGGQIGAARASLCNLIDAFVNHGFDVTDVLSRLVEEGSGKIITSSHGVQGEDSTPLIDADLDKRRRRHKTFMRMLTDVELFTQVRPDAPSIAEDRMWDALSVPARFSVASHSEKLAAAIAIRIEENAENKRNHSGGFNDAASNSLGESRRDMTRSFRATQGESGGGMSRPWTNVLRVALEAVGKHIAKARGHSPSDVGSLLFRNPNRFEMFLPALEKNMSQALTRLQSEYNATDHDDGGNAKTAYISEARRVTVLSCRSAVAAVQQLLDARKENHAQLAQTSSGLSEVQTWVCESTSSLNALGAIANNALTVFGSSSQADKEIVANCATLVIDKLLTCVKHRSESIGEASGMDQGQGGLPKRRRLGMDFEATEWGRVVRSCMRMLLQHGVEDEAFRLAEKYRDFGTMMSIKVSSIDFDAFLQKGLDSFGESFALYAFRWLEDRGKLSLLLRGRKESMLTTAEPSSVTRSERMKSVLSEYFRGEEDGSPNLGWLHWLYMGQLKSARRCLLKQLAYFIAARQEGSVLNTKVVSSIAKLTVIAEANSGRQDEYSMADEMPSAMLEYTSIQDKIAPDSKSLLTGSELIRKAIDGCSSESEELSNNVVTALSVVNMWKTIQGEMRSEVEYIWRRCIERQEERWSSLASSWASISDNDLREDVRGTAFYLAMSKSSLEPVAMEELIAGGLLRETAFEKKGCADEVVKLLRTALQLLEGGVVGVDDDAMML